MKIERPAIDIHCHIFNLKYLIDEIYVMLTENKIDFNKLPKMSFNKPGAKNKIPDNSDNLPNLLINLIKWLNEVWGASIENPEKNFLTILESYTKAFDNNISIITVPLMMDIYYMFSEFTVDSSKIDINQKILKNNISDSISDEKYNLLKQIQKEISEHIKNNDKSNDTLEDCIMSVGYKKHFFELLELQKKYPHNIFPFLAVDPRRPNIINIMKKYVTKKGPFYGIKLYQRMGYKPNSDGMEQIIAYCIQYDIPITAHTSQGGFPPFSNWIYDDFCNPVHWDNILRKNPHLRLNLAHFGGYNEEWKDNIIYYLKKYKNVYTDVSCYTQKEKLINLKDRFNEHKILKKKLMFGTDYVVMLLTNFNKLDEYFENFNPIKNIFFSEEVIKSIMYDNPRKFLNKNLINFYF